MARKKLSLKQKLSNFFTLSWKKVLIVPIVFIVAAVIHNLVYAASMYFFKVDFDEPVFFLLAVIGVPLYVIISIIYTPIRKFIIKK